jgi:hypothetical protein
MVCLMGYLEQAGQPVIEPYHQMKRISFILGGLHGSSPRIAKVSRLSHIGMAALIRINPGKVFWRPV